MDFSLGVITGIYGVIALIIFYIVYIIEVKLDIPYGSNENRELHGLSHTRLRQLIECIIAETLKLPNKTSIQQSNENDNNQNDITSKNSTEQYFEPKNYQDLLATAVLNKIVDTHGKDRLISGSSPNLSNRYDKNHNTLLKQNTISSESSSIEPRRESSLTEADKLLNEPVKNYSSLSSCGSYSNLFNDNLETGRNSMLSDYIASHMVPLPDISGATTTTTETDSIDEDDNLSQASTVSHEDKWEENWLFKKKHNSKNKITSANSIGMLVPAPKDDIRAQIGDKTADEMSDLSEAGSDIEESLSSSSSSLLDFVKGSKIDPLNDRLLNKHLIGGKNTADVLDEMIEQTSMISSSSLPDYEPIYKETLNEHVKGIDNINFNENHSQCESINGNEKKSILKRSLTNLKDKKSNKDLILPPPSSFSDDDQQSVVNGNHDETNSQLSSSISEPLSGSIAEREYQKWYNAVEMPNNPYSPEALRRRLSNSSEKFIDLPNITPSTQTNVIQTITINSSDDVELKQNSDYQRYSRDYYINDAKYSSGKKNHFSTMKTTLSDGISSKTLKEVNHYEYELKYNRAQWKSSSNENIRCASSLNFTNNSTKNKLYSFLYHKNCDNNNKTTTKLQTSSSSSLSSDLSNPNILSQFEKQLLHKDLKRNSFRAISATTKEFVFNPLYDIENFYSDNKLKKTTTNEIVKGDNEDSGVDSCLNGS